MNSRDLHDWMWAEAIDLLGRAERMHRQFFQPAPAVRGTSRGPVWEPPMDVFETEREMVILIALPGVAAENVQVGFNGAVLSVVAERALPSRAATAIRRVEIPHGRFERHIELPGEVFELVRRDMANGCLALVFARRPAQGTQP